MAASDKSLVLCFDGTWNTLKSHTNVSRLYSEIADESTGSSRQRKFYDEGVGTNWYDRLRGGVFGAGLDRNIRVGYAWLASVYESDAALAPHGPARDIAADPAREVPRRPQTGARQPNGDLAAAPVHSSGAAFLTGSALYLFGFSRGAYTARSLGGLINYLGIPRITLTGDRDAAQLAENEVITQAWSLYAERPSQPQRDAAAKEPQSSDAQRVRDHDAKVAAFRRAGRFPVRIHFIGVWDTVGSLGIPRVWDASWIPRFSDAYQFHDTSLCECVRNAFHAVAIDENRLPYMATLWTKAPLSTEAVEQCWFPGAHGDVGGGYEDDLLPDPPLKWLADRAAECGLEFVDDRRAPTADGTLPASIARAPARFDLDGREYLSPVHDSYAEFAGGVYRVMRSLPFGGGRVYRRMMVPADGINQKIDDTAFAKWRADVEYRPPNLGQAGRVDVSFNTGGGDGGMAAEGV